MKELLCIFRLSVGILVLFEVFTKMAKYPDLMWTRDIDVLWNELFAIVVMIGTFLNLKDFLKIKP